MHRHHLITYIPLGESHVYLTAVMDWSSRYVISWHLINSLDESLCVECLKEALQKENTLEIFNTDQSSQFTGEAFTTVLKDAGIRIKYGRLKVVIESSNDYGAQSNMTISTSRATRR